VSDFILKNTAASRGGAAIRIDCRGKEAFNAPWSFASLLDPIAPHDFCLEYWGKRPLHLAFGRKEYFNNLISLAELEQYFSADEFFTRQSVMIPIRSEELDNAPPYCLSALYENFACHRPLKLRRLETLLHPASPILVLLRDMEIALRHPKNSLSCYVAPPNAPGLGPHHDETEIFTLQISGAKRWRFFHKVVAGAPGIHEPGDLGAPDAEFVLEAGDFLYIPGGQVHEVTTLDDTPSFSLTIVFAPFRWSALLDLLAARLRALDAFVAPIPAGSCLDDNAESGLRQDFEARTALIRETLAGLTEADLVDRLALQHIKQMTLPPGSHLPSVFAINEIGLETIVEKIPGVVCRLVRDTDRISLVLPGGYALQAAIGAEPALRALLKTEGSFRVSNIDDSLSASAKRAFAQRLVGCGFLKIVSAS
jgi:hypothetical protein